ncbi:MAG: 3-hydroxybutyrate dehydrogenase [Opitutaceae bacterium]|tara:strand:- start:2532 stop:3311 length:780 start_codon:yes stop_codon:yes gene_type:complete
MKNRVVLITGSTSGIGLGMAHAFAREGAHVMLHGLGDPAEIEQQQLSLAETYGVTVGYHSADARVATEMTELVAATEVQLGSLDILINNAGVQFVSPVEDFPEERWTQIQDVIIGATFHATKAAIPGMKQRGWGRIINLVSAHGLVASPFKSAYVAAKHAQVGFTKSVALELAETSITCNAICPGYVLTPLVEAQIEAQAKVHDMPRERVIKEVILAAQPTKRFITVEEVAALAVYLSGDQAGSITGASIPIDGGWTAR